MNKEEHQYLSKRVRLLIESCSQQGDDSLAEREKELERTVVEEVRPML